MNKAIWAAPLLALGVVGLIGCDAMTGSGDGITGAMLVDAGADSPNWITHGRTYDEQRFPPLDQINAETVGGLGSLIFGLRRRATRPRRAGSRSAE